jgi:hypothetical protein
MNSSKKRKVAFAAKLKLSVSSIFDLFALYRGFFLRLMTAALPLALCMVLISCATLPSSPAQSGAVMSSLV